MLELHPYAELFPIMTVEQFRQLKESISERGLEDPIVLYRGKVIDGRNRLRACFDLDIKPKTIEYTGDDPLGYVIAKNDARRHLTKSQRGFVAGKMANLGNGKHSSP